MRIHISWELPFDHRTSEELGRAMFELARYCYSLEGDDEGIVLECMEVPEEELKNLKGQMKYVSIELEAEEE